MSSYFGFIADAAERDSSKDSSGGGGDTSPQRGFTDTRRSDETEYWSFTVRHAFLHGEVFQDTFFDFIESIMVFIEDTSCFGGGDGDRRAFLPGQREDGVKISSCDGSFSGHSGHHFEFPYFVLTLFAGLFAHSGFLHALFKRVGFGALVVSEFFLYGSCLFLQIVFAVIFFHLVFDASTDFTFNFLDFGFAADDSEERISSFAEVGHFEHFLSFFNINRKEADDMVDEPFQVINFFNLSEELIPDFAINFGISGDMRAKGTTEGSGFIFGRLVLDL